MGRGFVERRTHLTQIANQQGTENLTFMQQKPLLREQEA